MNPLSTPRRTTGPLPSESAFLFRPSSFREWLRALCWDFGYCVSMSLFTLGFSLRFEGGRNVPARGPALLAANHQSFFDPVLVGLAASNRRVAFLARKTLFKGAFAVLIRGLNAVSVDQEGLAKEGLRAVLERLDAGWPVVIFPEGNRTDDGRMHPLKPGIYLLLKRTKAPVIPVGIAGAFDALPRGRSWPRFTPLLAPVHRPGGIAVSVGRPLDSARLGALPREQALTELYASIEQVQRRAERLRRQPRG
jgi:1-acyl-sn-glycerol-3-phosphate acyltransferase